MVEKFAQANGITLAYETFGDPADPAMLLVMGLGTQMLGWPDGFCDALVARGLHVIRSDNRDIGLSSHLSDAPAPDLAAIFRGDTSSGSYTLSSMAGDTDQRGVRDQRSSLDCVLDRVVEIQLRNQQQRRCADRPKCCGRVAVKTRRGPDIMRVIGIALIDPIDGIGTGRARHRDGIGDQRRHATHAHALQRTRRAIGDDAALRGPSVKSGAKGT